MAEQYNCRYCGRWMPTKTRKKQHEKTCGVSKLDEFTENN